MAVQKALADGVAAADNPEKGLISGMWHKNAAFLLNGNM
jgi:hypothetical protein